MNDIVMQSKGLKYELDSKNKSNKATFTVTLRAAGATVISAAAMLDKIPASSISSVAYQAQKRNSYAGTSVKQFGQYTIVRRKR